MTSEPVIRTDDDALLPADAPDPATGHAEPEVLSTGGPTTSDQWWRRRPPGPGAALRHLGPRSLSARLIAGVVALVVVLVVAITTTTYYALGAFLTHRLDQQLQSTANGPLREVFAGTESNGSTVRSPVHVWAVALDSQGRVLAGPLTTMVEAMRLSTADRRSLGSGSPSGARTVETTDGQELRVTTRPALAANSTTGELSRAVAVVGLSTYEENKVLARLVRQELLVGGGAVLLALLATLFGVRFSLRGLYRVTGTAQDVAAELSPDGAGLDRRVPVTEQGTEVGQLAESMNTLLAAVETQFAARIESEERMRRFLADASHELRTPLTSIRGYAELARMQRAAGTIDEDNLDRIEAEGTRMSRLVEDLLMLARSDRGGEPRRELVDVSELIGDALNGARAAYPARGFLVDETSAHQVIGDPDQLLRVLRNLINNAAMHTRPEAAIRVGAVADGPGVALQVIDGGPGLPPEEAAHVFERFWRADKARTRARGGTGLGLSIVASIVAAHGGSVRFDSTVEGGSTVTVWLPAVDAVGYDA